MLGVPEKNEIPGNFAKTGLLDLLGLSQKVLHSRSCFTSSYFWMFISYERCTQVYLCWQTEHWSKVVLLYNFMLQHRGTHDLMQHGMITWIIHFMALHFVFPVSNSSPLPLWIISRSIVHWMWHCVVASGTVMVISKWAALSSFANQMGPADTNIEWAGCWEWCLLGPGHSFGQKWFWGGIWIAAHHQAVVR